MTILPNHDKTETEALILLPNFDAAWHVRHHANSPCAEPAMTTRKRFTANHVQLLVVDLQERLLPVVDGHKLVEANTARLIQAAALLEIPTVATVQYPKGLGPTVPAIAELLKAEPIAKMTFSAAAPAEVQQRLDKARAVVLAGIETHVCIAQTALDLLDLGYTVLLPVDAVSARHRADHNTAIARLTQAGVVPTTTEAALFEWLETAEHTAFKAISRMVKEFKAQ